MEKLRVIFLSSWLGSPYKTLLSDHLGYKGVHVEEYQQPRTFLPIIFKRGKVDILHLHSTLQNLLIKGNSIIPQWFRLIQFITQLFLLRLMGIKTIWTVHEWADKHYRSDRDIPESYYAIIGKFLHAIITHCESTKHEVSKAFKLEGENKVLVIPHGNFIDLYENKISQIEARKHLNIPEENLVFLCFGGIYTYKGVLEAIDAFKCLPKGKVSFVIAGKIAKGEPELKDLILEKIKGYNNILFVPEEIPDDEVQIYMNACDCVMTPYQTFTTSGVTLLAMSFGRACIAPKAGFFQDVLDESGAFLYDASDQNGLLQAMKSAIEKQDELLTMGEHNLEIAQQWSWDYIAEETLNIYQGS